jgi:hypothetical protein
MDGFEIVAPGASGEAVFSGFALKWLSDAKMDKMVTRGRLSIHLQEALKLSKEWGEGQRYQREYDRDLRWSAPIDYRS